MQAQATLNQVNALATHTALSAYAVLGNVLVLLILAGALFLFAGDRGHGGGRGATRLAGRFRARGGVQEFAGARPAGEQAG